MATQQKALCILRIAVLSSQVCMNLESFEALGASLVFEKLPKETQELLTSIMLAPMETASVEEEMAAEGAAPKVVSVEVPREVPKSSRSPRLRPTPTKDAPKPKKDKKKVA